MLAKDLSISEGAASAKDSVELRQLLVLFTVIGFQGLRRSLSIALRGRSCLPFKWSVHDGAMRPGRSSKTCATSCWRKLAREMPVRGK